MTMSSCSSAATDDGKLYGEKIMAIQVDGAPVPGTPIPSRTFTVPEMPPKENVVAVNAVAGFFLDPEEGELSTTVMVESSRPETVSAVRIPARWRREVDSA